MAETRKFQELVNEAFISPLRSVLIVDDQYPTWEEIFNSNVTGEAYSKEAEANTAGKLWRSDSSVAGEIVNLIKKFRDQKPGLIIDIHDGASVDNSQTSASGETPKQLADHLHQSDLLILDYNLEGPEAGTGGDTARKIIASVLDNQHFNLVVVHTSEDLTKSIHECLRALLPSCTSKISEACEIEINELDELIVEKEDIGEFDRSHIKDKLDMGTYLEARNSDGSIINSARRDFMKEKGAFADLKAWADQLELTKRQQQHFFYWAICTFEKPYLSDFTSTPPTGLSWSITDDHKWLRTSRGFVCFVKKGPENLLSELEAALVDWKPTPSRLLSAKYRHEISRIGAEVEDSSLRHKHAFAKFYETIIKPGKDSLSEEQIELLRYYKLKDHVSRQSEMISFLVEDNVAEFGKRIYDADASNGFSFKQHYGVDLDRDADKSKAIKQYNHYVCCLPSKKDISSESNIKEQLDSGHIFKIGGNWWVCATPACDLQPGQNVIAFKKGDPDLMPFTAMPLFLAKNDDKITDSHINSGSYCYVDYCGEIIALGPHEALDNNKKPPIQKVNWKTFVAKKGGLIVNGKLQLLEFELALEDGKIKTYNREALVITKLRYEYALNYIQKVGASVARIGLEYVSK